MALLTRQQILAAERIRKLAASASGRTAAERDAYLERARELARKIPNGPSIRYDGELLLSLADEHRCLHTAR